MNIKSLLLISAFVALAGPALAQQAPPQMPMPGQGQGQRPSPFERMDTNNDGVITREEVRAARTAGFARLDANRDGFLVREEMQVVHDGMRHAIGMGHQGGSHLLAGADTNNDGNITTAEFDAAWRTAQAAKANSGDRRRIAMFERLDANRDGVISAAEVAAAQAARPQRGGGQGGPPQGRSNPDTNNDQKISLAEWLARPDPLFDRGDANNDGRVTREEAAAIVRQGRGQDGRPNRPW